MSRSEQPADDAGDEGRLTVAEAFERFDTVVALSTAAGGTTPRVHDADADCQCVSDDATPVAPHEVPHSARVCRRCDPRHDGSQGPDQRGTSPLRGRRICGCMGCTDEAHVIVQHPKHGRRAVCPDHRRDYPVVEEVDA